MRRLAATVATALIVVLATAGIAAAAVTASVTSPGGKIEGPAGVSVRVDRELTDSVTDVGARLRRGGDAVWVAPLTCGNCGPAWTTSDWGGKTLNPSGLPNGTYQLHPVVDGKEFGGREVWISVPPSRVSNLKTAVSGQDVTVSWTRAPEPDISGYRVQRRIFKGGAWQQWQQIKTVGPGADRYAERLSPGKYEYRIVTVRPDGKGGHITVTSSAVAAEVLPPPTPTQPSETSDGGSTEGTGGSTDGSTGGGDGGSTGPTGGTTVQPGSGTATGDPASADGEGTGDEGTGGDGPQQAPSEASTPQTSARTAGAGRRVAPPPGVRRSLMLSGGELSLPDPQVAGPRERFYGQDQPFSEELDYGDIDPITGEPRVRDGTATRRVPGAVQEFVVARLNTPLVAIPIAAGLLCIALGLHGMRWLRQG